MAITIDLPSAIEQELRASVGNLDAVAKEAALVEFYRQGVLSHGQFAKCLGLSRTEADAILAQHHVTEDLLTIDELDEQTRLFRQLLGQ